MMLKQCRRFPEVALDWITALLEECGKERQGVNLFGKDNLLLGRLLTTLVKAAF